MSQSNAQRDLAGLVTQHVGMPTFGTLTAPWITPIVVPGSDDLAGRVSALLNGVAVSNTLGIITFAQPFCTPPRSVIVTGNAINPAQAWLGNLTESGFTLFVNGPPPGLTYTFNYHVDP